MEATERCSACKRTKTVAEFGRTRSLGDGLSFSCLECNRARNNRWYRSHRRRMGNEVRDPSWVPDGSRWCAACRQAAAHADQVRSTITASGSGSRCTSCHNAANDAACRCRKYGLTKAEVAELRVAQRDRCASCGEPEPQHPDHDRETGAGGQLVRQRCAQGSGPVPRTRSGFLHAAAYYVAFHRARREVAAALKGHAEVPSGTAGRAARR